MKNLSLALALATFASPLFAADTTTLAEEYVNMPEVQAMITTMFSPETMASQMKATLPAQVAVTDDQLARIGVVLSEAMQDMRPRMEELMVTGTAETFSAEEINALIDFYGSEHGAAVMSKMTPFMISVMAELGPEMTALQAQIGPEVARIIQE